MVGEFTGNLDNLTLVENSNSDWEEPHTVLSIFKEIERAHLQQLAKGEETRPKIAELFEIVLLEKVDQASPPSVLELELRKLELCLEITLDECNSSEKLYRSVLNICNWRPEVTHPLVPILTEQLLDPSGPDERVRFILDLLCATTPSRPFSVESAGHGRKNSHRRMHPSDPITSQVVVADSITKIIEFLDESRPDSSRVLKSMYVVRELIQAIPTETSGESLIQVLESLANSEPSQSYDIETGSHFIDTIVAHTLDAEPLICAEGAKTISVIHQRGDLPDRLTTELLLEYLGLKHLPLDTVEAIKRLIAAADRSTLNEALESKKTDALEDRKRASQPLRAILRTVSADGAISPGGESLVKECKLDDFFTEVVNSAIQTTESWHSSKTLLPFTKDFPADLTGDGTIVSLTWDVIDADSPVDWLLENPLGEPIRILDGFEEVGRENDARKICEALLKSFRRSIEKQKIDARMITAVKDIGEQKPHLLITKLEKCDNNLRWTITEESARLELMKVGEKEWPSNALSWVRKSNPSEAERIENEIQSDQIIPKRPKTDLRDDDEDRVEKKSLFDLLVENLYDIVDLVEDESKRDKTLNSLENCLYELDEGFVADENINVREESIGGVASWLESNSGMNVETIEWEDETNLTRLSGINENLEERLNKAGFETVEDVREASPNCLLKVNHLGADTYKKIQSGPLECLVYELIRIEIEDDVGRDYIGNEEPIEQVIASVNNIAVKHGVDRGVADLIADEDTDIEEINSSIEKLARSYPEALDNVVNGVWVNPSLTGDRKYGELSPTWELVCRVKPPSSGDIHTTQVRALDVISTAATELSEDVLNEDTEEFRRDVLHEVIVAEARSGVPSLVTIEKIADVLKETTTELSKEDEKILELIDVDSYNV